MLRGVLAITVALVGFLLSGMTQAGAESVLDLDVAPSKARYTDGEPVRLTLTVTNRGTAACSLPRLADGSVQVQSVMRDGEPVLPAFSLRSYTDGLAAAIRATMVDVAAGDSVTVYVDGEETGGIELVTAAGSATDDGLATLWPVGGEGRYEVALAFRAPSTTGVCAGATGVRTATFTVGGAGEDSGSTVWWLFLAIGAGVILVVALVLWRVRRRVPRSAAVVLFVLALLPVTVLSGRVAWAKTVISGSPEFTNQVNGCLDTFAGMGGEFKQIADTIRDPNGPSVYISESRGGSDHLQLPLQDPPGSKRYGSKVRWDPTNAAAYSDGTARHPTDHCPDLLHELTHAADSAKGGIDDTECASTKNPDDPGDRGIRKSEIRAVNVQNRYMRARYPDAVQKNWIRKKYAGGVSGTDLKDVPTSETECDKPKPPPPPPPPRGGCSPHVIGRVSAPPLLELAPGGTTRRQRQGAGCAISDGDPHLVTFDGRHYDFQAVGEFVAARSGTGDFEVQTRQSPADPQLRTVSVNAAVAMRVGDDRVGFYLRDGEIVVRVDGENATVGTDGRTLPDGGEVTRRPAPAGAGGYTVNWPDGSTAEVDSVGWWGLRLMVAPDARHRDTLSGLLGDGNDDPRDDLAPRGGDPIEKPTFEQTYRTFGDSWRVDDEESLFDYGSGESTRTFTDRSFPERQHTVADLPSAQREQARALCRQAGITDEVLLDACTLDVATTGSPIFAVGGADTQQAAQDSAGESGEDGGDDPDAGTTLNDGDTVSAGRLESADSPDFYDLDLGDATEFEILDVVGDVTFTIAGYPAPRTVLPGGNKFALPAPTGYRLQVSGDRGTYGFRLVTLKHRELNATVGDTITGTLDVPGRVDSYVVGPSGAPPITLTDGRPCAGDLRFGVLPYSSDPYVYMYSPADPCDPSSFTNDQPGGRHLIVVWSVGATTGDYTFTIGRS